MTERQLRTAVEALLQVRDSDSPPAVSSFVCPYPDCQAYAAHTWGLVRVAATPTMKPGAWGSRSLNPMQKVWVAQCSVCYKEVIFLDDGLIWPAESEAPTPNVSMPPDVAADFEEARQIYLRSPRGAAALLRLALQKLCAHLGVPGDINSSIGTLVAEGRISNTIQQALDSLRVIGNEAVHPGTLDLKDDPGTALKLFKLLNIIVEKTIAEPAHIAEIFGNLPPAKLKGIADRDRGNGVKKAAAVRKPPRQ
jgi:hypothetical protein